MTDWTEADPTGTEAEAPPPRTRRRLWLLLAGAASIASPLALSPISALQSNAANSSGHVHMDCKAKASLCTEVYDSEKVFGEGVYVGHDEPSLLFYSNTPGSGNHYSSNLTLPVQPPPPPAGQTGTKSYDFQLHPAFWFGMAVCDTQSYPELVNTCVPNSDQNIADPKQTPYHAGTAFMEMQFYPPGWVSWPAGVSCDPTKWCAALNIDSLLEDPVHGTAQNAACQSHVGIEPVNFAFITLSGTPHAPPSPVNATAATFTPNPATDLFMNGGDVISVSMRDTTHGLRIDLKDKTSGQNGSMTASAANGFGQVQFDPNGTSCNNIPYDFHPMYSTTSEQTRVPWAAHTYNVAFSDEIGHFDFCQTVNQTNGSCSNNEGSGSHKEPTDADDTSCFDKSQSLLIQYSGCIGSNVPGFDGTSYLDDYPNGSPNRPTPIQFTSFKSGTGTNFDTNYSRVAFESDLPRVEQGLHGCDPYNNTGCTHLPITDDGTAAQFYPFYSTASHNGSCTWVYGSDVAGLSTNDYGKWNQYGNYDSTVYYTGPGGTPYQKSDDFRNVLSSNPCRS